VNWTLLFFTFVLYFVLKGIWRLVTAPVRAIMKGKCSACGAVYYAVGSKCPFCGHGYGPEDMKEYR